MLFAKHATAFWALGLPAIPLLFQEKRPAINDWSRFDHQLPTKEEQAQWLMMYADNNIGLALGAQSGMVMLDIDTTDDKLIALIRGAMPGSPWCRIGAKGMMLAYKFTGTPTFRIKDVAGHTIVEHLSARTQIVLPPSIHPDTKKPYVENQPLYEVVDQLVPLAADVEAILRKVITDYGIMLSHSGWTKVTDYVSVGSRDVTMTSVAGLFAAGVTRGEITVKEAIERLKAWHSSCVDQIAGDDVDVDKGIANIVRFLRRDIEEKGKILPVNWDKDLTPEERQALGLEFDKEQEAWSFDAIKDFLHDAFESMPAESKGRMDAIDQALGKIGLSTGLSSLDQERLLKYIMDAGGVSVTLGALRARMKELQKGSIVGTDQTEIAKAVIADIRAVHPVAFYGKKFQQWNGSHWEEYERHKILNIVANSYGHLVAAKKNSDHKGVMEIVSNQVDQEIKSLAVKGVNFANGVVLENLQLVPHTPEYGMMYTLPFNYRPELVGKAYKFDAFLWRCWGRDSDYKEKVLGLQEAICATIFGISTQFQRAFLLYGAPKTGKSQLLEIIQRLVPDNARSFCSPDTWGDKFSPATMLGKVINVAGELSDREIIAGKQFKQIVGGEEMQVQFKGLPIFPMRPQCAHWFASNHQPKTDDTSSAFGRRWVVFTFNHPIQEHEKVINLGEDIVADEREAIAAWAIEALPRLRSQNEFTLSASHKQIIDEVSNANNSVRYFMKESGMLVYGEGKECPEMKLHSAYFNFCCGPGGAKPFGIKAFRAKMRELGSEMSFSLDTGINAAGITVCTFRGVELRSGR